MKIFLTLLTITFCGLFVLIMSIPIVGELQEGVNVFMAWSNLIFLLCIALVGAIYSLEQLEELF